MKTTITKKLLAFALSAFSISAVAQCPTSVSITVNSNTANGNLNVSPVFFGYTPTTVNNQYHLTGASNNYYTYTLGSGSANFSNVASGNYTLCLTADSVNYQNACPPINTCMQITITNTTLPVCNADFSYSTDSTCTTHLTSTSTGAGSWLWYIDGISNNSPNPSVNLSNGTHYVTLLTYNGGGFCDSIVKTITVGCGGGSCNSSFTYSTDLNCVTHLINTSTNSTSSQWYVDNIPYTSTNVNLNLSNGTHFVALYSYINNSFCDSTTQVINVACTSNTASPCQANSNFTVFADSLNPGSFFAYNMSVGTGTLGYSWDFGDGTPPSTQQYPFHQYAVPGSYVICLTITANSGTVVCTDTHCDSSSTQRIAAGFLMSQLNVIPQTTTEIKENESITGVKAFPNPITDELTIDVAVKDNSKLNYMLTDALGRVVETGSLEDNKATINTSNLSKGFYSLSITTQNGNSLKAIKLVK